MNNEAPRLIADVGGTNARFALVKAGRVHAELELAVAEHPDFAAAVEHYLREAGASHVQHRPQEAAIAIAAPLSGDQVKMTNHPWRFSIKELRQQLSLRRLIVLNDFTALAMAIRSLPPSDLEQIGGQHPEPAAPIALLGPGTGLGVSGLIPSGDYWIPLQGEGGHVSLAPGNLRELEILRQLWRRFEHVSAERVLSGPGLINLYAAICMHSGLPARDYEPADITHHALNDTDASCAEALQIFCGLLGSVAGNLVLTLGAVGGVYIGGGIVPRLGEYFARSTFRARFEDKGRYVSYLAAVPAYVIRAERPAFTGLIQSFNSPSPRIEASA